MEFRVLAKFINDNIAHLFLAYILAHTLSSCMKWWQVAIILMCVGLIKEMRIDTIFSWGDIALNGVGIGLGIMTKKRSGLSGVDGRNR
jgi:hypothetical protein